uniref:Si:ch211-165i18.2 n=1 Tax=Sinocyclocheilus grahami TaxID=75366 RepID=A0A672LV03_SINGR
IVTVPSHIWTAVCYKHHLNDTNSFSFGYIGKNQPESGIRLMRVSDLNDKLSRLHSELLKSRQSVKIFVGDCFDDSKKLNGGSGYQMATDVQNMSRTLKRVVRSSQHSHFTVGGYWCRYDHPCGTHSEDYYWCRTGHGFFFDSWDYCSPPLSGSRAKNGEYCHSNYACGTYGSDHKWCYTVDGNKDRCCTSDDCLSAVNDKTCWSEHPCGYHGYSYLWCYTDDESNWDYCCKDCGQEQPYICVVLLSFFYIQSFVHL